MNRRQLIIGVLALAVVALGVVAYVVMTPSTGANLSSGGSAYSFKITGYDRTLGNPKAPLQVIEYAAPSCPVCAHFNATMFPTMKRYIDAGKVFYVFRVMPINQVDIAVEGMARCLPADNYLEFIDLLFRNQAKWDPDGHDILDVHAALLDMGRIAGMSADRADKCIGDEATQKKTNAIAEEANKVYGVNGTPTFFVNGSLAPYFRTPDDVKAYLDQVLAQKK
jgi:protein-disulfide isomerase